tara:strand:- start:1097 stop:1294 length:198 start_codon:yes stop_codon:yes gene_type:complete
MKVIRTLTCTDGVTGLNGYQYALDDKGKCLTFDNEAKARDFLIANGVHEELILNGDIEIIDDDNN